MNSNCHLYDPFDSELCLVGAPDDDLLAGEMERLIRFLEQAPEATLPDVAYTCASAARGMPAVVAIVATSTTDLRERLTLAHKKISAKAARIRDRSGTFYFRDRLCPEGRIAFLFPGVTSFYPDMLRDLCLVFNNCREAFDELEEALQHGEAREFVPSDYIFPPGTSQRGSAGAFSAQGFCESLVAAHTVNTALYRLFTRLGVCPDGLAGFSGGDFTALEAAGVFGKLSRNKRIVFMREGYQMLKSLVERGDLPDCVMLSLVDAPQKLLDTLAAEYHGRLVVSFSHSPRLKTIAFAPAIQKEVAALLQKAGIRTMKVPIDRPFNTPWCSRALPSIRQFLAHWIRCPPRVALYSCATAARLPPQPREIQNLTTDLWTAPIRFDDTIRQMHADGYRVFVELGARGNMTNAIDDTLKGLPHQAVAINRIHRSGLVQLHHALALLAAQGVPLDATQLHRHRGQRLLDFERPMLATLRTDNSMPLTADLPSFSLIAPTAEFQTTAAATPGQERKPMPVLGEKRSLNFGADFPLLANASIIEEQPGVMVEIVKVLNLDDYPFLRDYSLGTAQLSHANPDLKGLTLLSLASGLEMLCEAAHKVVPRRRVAQVDNLRAQRWVGFERGSLRVTLRAERIAWPDTRYAAVRVQLRDDTPNSAFTWPIIEATVLLTAAGAVNHPIQPPPLTNPRTVNWSSHDIYPERLFHGKNLRIVRHVDLWSEEGVDFEVEVPRRSEAVRHTRIPLFSIWPMLIDGIVSSFALWRSHEKFAGAISMPFRARRIIFNATNFTEGARLRGYLRLISVTPRSHVADIQVSDGQGNLLIHFRGWEELCERVPPEYQQYILRPSENFLSRELPAEVLGAPNAQLSAAVISEIPFKIFESNQELWLKTLANVLLAPVERVEWVEKQGATNRRAEWLFGRAAAKEAARRFLKKHHQARWTSADIPIWPDDSGKPHALGPWREHTNTKLDLSITHTSRLIIAAVAANARIGIDVEKIGRTLSEDFTKGVFTHEELELAAHTGEAPVAILRFWCAKEAISKALGTGIRYSPQDLRVTSCEADSGAVTIELLGQWLESFKNLKGRQNAIHTTIYEGHALAACVLPASLFDLPD